MAGKGLQWGSCGVHCNLVPERHVKSGTLPVVGHRTGPKWAIAVLGPRGPEESNNNLRPRELEPKSERGNRGPETEGQSTSPKGWNHSHREAGTEPEAHRP